MAKSRFETKKRADSGLLWLWPEYELALEFPPPAPYVVGILNVTPDSFSDGGDFLTVENALNRARAITGEGATVIDVGGQSTRPGYSPVNLEEEKRRVIPVLKAIKEALPGYPLISIDTDKAELADEALGLGIADIINDTSGGDVAMAKVAARRNAPLILTHRPAGMGRGSLSAVTRDLETIRERYIGAGLQRDYIAIDPGLGFGKDDGENLALLSGCAGLLELGSPLHIGASRKRFIGSVTGNDEPESRLGGSLAAAVWSALAGASFTRVHDVRETVEALAMIKALRECVTRECV